jgi:hypothetical protein
MAVVGGSKGTPKMKSIQSRESRMSYRGWPGADSDIYCNTIANCWDDGIEVEGAGENVRIWNNYIENTMMTIANAATSIGIGQPYVGD